jgi:hypothetical protein
MARITKVGKMENRTTYGLVKVWVDGEEATVIVGGECEVYFSDKYDRAIAFVKKHKLDTAKATE